jgi:uncharacterized phage protein (TIGR01671 family)
MRELKFRVWDVETKRFFKTDYNEHLSVAISVDGKTLYQNYVGGDKEIGKDVIIQQFTGLKDKNGVEIYEGDIVKVYSEEFENENFTGKVIFDEGSFLTWINKNDIRGVWSGDDIEVVGNIMENPELLKQ